MTPGEPTQQDAFAAPETPALALARAPLTLLALGGVFATFVLASGLVVKLLGVNAIALLVTNVLVLGGGALMVGWLRRLFSGTGIGLLPPRIHLTHIAVSAAIGVAMLPFRAAIGLAAQLLIEGNLDSVMARGALLTGQAFSWSNAVAMVILGGLLVPIAEELLFRAGLFGWLRTRFALWPSVIVSAIVFGAAHVDSLGTAVSAVLLGVACAWVYARYASIWAPIAIHVTTNTLAMLLLQVSLYLQPQAN
jgi:membrane protease YdiL (CAAX protease family)